MRFPNAYKGLKKIYRSEILILIVGILTGIAGFFGAQAASQIAEQGEEGITAATAFGVMIPIMVSGIITIIAAFMQFLGLKNAAKDDAEFKKGYTYALIGLALAIVFGILSIMKIENAMITDLSKILSNFIEIVITFYIITGIISLSEKLDDPEMAARGKKIFYMYAAGVILASLVDLICTVMNLDKSGTIAVVLGGLSALLAVIAYVLYLGYLGKAKRMLA